MRLALLALSFVCSSVLVTSTVSAQPVAVPRFDSVGLSGSGDIRIRHGAQQQVIIRRGDPTTSEITVRRDGSLAIRSCRQFCPSGYRLEVEIITPTLGDLAISGSGTMTVGSGFGSAAQRNLAVSGSGMIDASALSAAQMDAAVNGSGKIRVGAVRNLQAAISGSGFIGYSGPAMVQSAISGSGHIERER